MKKIIVGSGLALIALAAVARSQDACDVTKLKAILGCEEAIYLRGEAKLTDGKATIALPTWFEPFTKADGHSVQLTCRDGWSPLWSGAVADGKFTVQTNGNGNSTQAFWWEVKAVAKQKICSPPTGTP